VEKLTWELRNRLFGNLSPTALWGWRIPVIINSGGKLTWVARNRCNNEPSQILNLFNLFLPANSLHCTFFNFNAYNTSIRSIFPSLKFTWGNYLNIYFYHRKTKHLKAKKGRMSHSPLCHLLHSNTHHQLWLSSLKRHCPM